MGARVALCGPGRAGAVVRSLGPGDVRIVEMSCESGRWAKVARLESGVRGTMMSCQLGRETRGTVLEAASEVGLALSSAASVWSSVGAAREHRIFLLCESSSWPVRGKLAENPRSRPIVRPRSLSTTEVATRRARRQGVRKMSEVVRKTPFANNKTKQNSLSLRSQSSYLRECT